MIYGSVCSGIEGASAAWGPLGWQPSFFSEIEDFPRAVLRHRYPEVPLHGDFTTIRAGDYRPIRLLVGGTPCQSFSVAASLGRNSGQENALLFRHRVRRLMPVECERLMGFPDGYTDVPWRKKNHSPASLRYAVLGNSMAVNVMSWVGQRIDMVDQLEMIA